MTPTSFKCACKTRNPPPDPPQYVIVYLHLKSVYFNGDLLAHTLLDVDGKQISPQTVQFILLSLV